MINRVQIAHERGWTIQEIYKARDAWRKLYSRQPESTITFDEYLTMIQEAGLRPNMVGLRRGQYHLARFNDSGAYSVSNCRFIPQEQNQKERKEGYQRKSEFRKLMSEIASHRTRKQCEHCMKSVSPGMFARWHGENCRQKHEPA